MIELLDTDKMPWGAHKDKLMQDVPASYFHFLWTNQALSKRTACPVADYIRKNLSALQQEYPNGIWE